MELANKATLFGNSPFTIRLPIMDIIDQQYSNVLRIQTGSSRIFTAELKNIQEKYYQMILLINSADLNDPAAVTNARQMLDACIVELEKNFRTEIARYDQTSQELLHAMSSLSVSFDEFKKQLVQMNLLSPSETSISADVAKHLAGSKGGRRDDDKESGDAELYRKGQRIKK